MNHKLLITLAVVSLSFTAFLSGYLISQKDFHRKQSSPTTGSVLDKFDGNSPEYKSRSESLRTLSPRHVISPVLSKDKDGVVYYEKDTGKVFEVSLKDLKEKSISDIPLANLLQTIWSPSRKEVVSVFYHPQGALYKYFNYKTRSSVTINANIKHLVFSPDGNQVAYFGKNGEMEGVFISQPDGNILKNILPSRLEDLEIYWPSNDSLFFKTTTTNGSEVYSLSKTGEVKKILGLKDNLDIKWSKDGSRLLFSEKIGSLIRLSYKDLSSEKETFLGVSTRASKCDWSTDGQFVTCGVPRSSASGDEIYKINIDGTINMLYSPSSVVNVAELFLSSLDDDIVILNELDSKLYLLRR